MQQRNHNMVYTGNPNRTKFPLRKPTIVITKKRKFHLYGGPYHGKCIPLVTPSTIIFSTGKYHGRYRPGKVVYTKAGEGERMVKDLVPLPFEDFESFDLIWENVK